MFLGDNLPNVMITVKKVSKLIQSLSKSTKYQVLNLPTQIQDCGVTSILDREGFFRERLKATSASSVDVASPLPASDTTDTEVRSNTRLREI